MYSRLKRLYSVGHMVKDHSDSERGNPLPPHGLLFLISSKGFYMHHPTDRIVHTTAYVTPVMKHWLEWELAQWVHHEGSIRQPIAPRSFTVNDYDLLLSWVKSSLVLVWDWSRSVSHFHWKLELKYFQYGLTIIKNVLSIIKSISKWLNN